LVTWGWLVVVPAAADSVSRLPMSIIAKPTTRRMIPMVHRIEILNRNPATRRMIPRTIIAFSLVSM
jgi:hypothetical protein